VLVELVTRKIATMILGKTTKQIQDMFGIKDDFTPEERKRQRSLFFAVLFFF